MRRSRAIGRSRRPSRRSPRPARRRRPRRPTRRRRDDEAEQAGEETGQGRDRLRRHPRAGPPRRAPGRDRDRPVLVARLEEAGVLGHDRGPNRALHDRDSRRAQAQAAGLPPIAQARWLEQGNQVVGLSAGSPASFPGGGGSPSAASASPTRTTPAAAERRLRRRRGRRWHLSRAGSTGGRPAPEIPRRVRPGWRHMRDGFYDEKLGNRNWDAIRRKYADAAAEAPDPDGLATVVNLMLGELNGSHLGFTATSGRVTARSRSGRGPRDPARPDGTW